MSRPRHKKAKRVSVIGIDNCGKTSVVTFLGSNKGMPTTHLTCQHHSDSPCARVLGGMVGALARFGERHQLRFITGCAYLAHLFPYYLDLRRKKNTGMIVSDRDPIIDTMCYSQIYLPRAFSRCIEPFLRGFVHYLFHAPDTLFYLTGSPDAAAARGKGHPQLHERRVEVLKRLTHLFDREVERLHRRGVTVITLDTDTRAASEIADHIADYLGSTGNDCESLPPHSE